MLKLYFFKKHGFIPFAISVLFVATAVIFFAKHDVTREPAGVILEEAGKMNLSKSDAWWLNSGGIVYIDGNNISTAFGDLKEGSKWQKLYAKTNPRDTQKGYQPQNIFRLVSRQKWQNFNQEATFNIQKINLSGSSFRNASNGVFLFNRYQDGDNLYYTGVRVDGSAVIKKKIGGVYYTMAQKSIFSAKNKYDLKNNPNLLPLHQVIGIRSELTNLDGGAVNIKFYVKKSGQDAWQLVLETTDSNDKFGGAPFLESGFAGIRTDFMDVSFENYSIKE